MAVRVRFRPTVAGDVEALLERPLPHRIQAITALIGDRVVGVGGLGFRPDGTVFAFAELSDELKRHPAAVHRAGRLGMALIRHAGVPLVLANAEAGNAKAARWLKRFGFEQADSDGRTFVWRRGS